MDADHRRFFSIVVVKQLFGGLGYNFANPAIVGRIAMAMGFAGRMSTYGFPQGVDATSAATLCPLRLKASTMSLCCWVPRRRAG